MLVPIAYLYWLPLELALIFFLKPKIDATF
jgi:hypothetical protein